MKSHFTAQPNPNKDIARSIIGESIKKRAAHQKELLNDQINASIERDAAKKIQGLVRGVKTRKHIGNVIGSLEKEIVKLENFVGGTKTSINERIPVSLRSNIKKLQDRKSELKTRPKGDVKEELSKINEKLGHYENILIKQKPGPKKKFRFFI